MINIGEGQGHVNGPSPNEGRHIEKLDRLVAEGKLVKKGKHTYSLPGTEKEIVSRLSAVPTPSGAISTDKIYDGHDRIVSPWAPDANPKQARRIGKAQEEVAELAKVLARISIQGLHSVNPTTGKTNFAELMEEISDVYAQCELMTEEFFLDPIFMGLRIHRKKKLMAEWEAHFPEQQ